MAEDALQILHLKKAFEDKECSQCQADLTKEGVYTFSAKVYQNPPPGYVKCRSIWVE